MTFRYDLPVNLIKTQMKVPGGALHSINDTLLIKKGPAALPSEAWCTHFNSDDFIVVANMSGDNSIDWKTWGLGSAFGCPFNVPGILVIPIIREFRKRVAESAQIFSLLD